MPMEIIIDAFGETEMKRTLLRFADRGDDMRPAFREIHKLFLHLEERQFEGQGIYSGGWAPLAQSTIDAKGQAGLDTRILIATGELMDSLTHEHDSHHRYDASKNEMIISSKVDYGKFHQSRMPRSRLPRRPPVEIPETEKRKWVQVLQQYLVKGHA